MNQRETFAQIAQLFEELQPQSVAQLKNLYSPTAQFKDPFNQVQGIEAIEQIFFTCTRHLRSRALSSPRR